MYPAGGGSARPRAGIRRTNTVVLMNKLNEVKRSNRASIRRKREDRSVFFGDPEGVEEEESMSSPLTMRFSQIRRSATALPRINTGLEPVQVHFDERSVENNADGNPAAIRTDPLSLPTPTSAIRSHPVVVHPGKTKGDRDKLTELFLSRQLKKLDIKPSIRDAESATTDPESSPESRMALKILPEDEESSPQPCSLPSSAPSSSSTTTSPNLSENSEHPVESGNDPGVIPQVNYGPS